MISLTMTVAGDGGVGDGGNNWFLKLYVTQILYNFQFLPQVSNGLLVWCSPVEIKYHQKLSLSCSFIEMNVLFEFFYFYFYFLFQRFGLSDFQEFVYLEIRNYWSCARACVRACSNMCMNVYDQQSFLVYANLCLFNYVLFICVCD